MINGVSVLSGMMTALTLSRSLTITDTKEGDMRIRTHPGEILREEFMKPYNVSAHALAMALRVPATRIGEIINERRAVTPDTALRLARCFGTTPEFWLNLQQAHDLSVTVSEHGAEIEQDVKTFAQA
jgi:addiction module HigA family antidote